MIVKQVMDDRWESEISEFGAINITGFRIVDGSRRYVQEFLNGWKSLDVTTSIGAGKESISVISDIFYESFLSSSSTNTVFLFHILHTNEGSSSFDV